MHECRHTYASFAIAAGVNAKALSDYLGHSSIKVTFDKYGHLMPGNEQQAADLLDSIWRWAGADPALGKPHILARSEWRRPCPALTGDGLIRLGLHTARFSVAESF